MKCPSCSNEAIANARFCSFCGGILPENPENKKEYKLAIQQYLLDGVLEPWEVRELALLRSRLNISEQTHNQLLRTFDYVDHNTIEVSIDISNIDFFRAQQQCQFRIQLQNKESYPIVQCSFIYQIKQGGVLFQSQPFSIASRTKINHTLPFIPQQAGQYELSGYIDIDDAQGRSYRYQFRNIHFNVSPPHVQHIQNISVGDNFTGVLDVQSPKDNQQIEGGLNLDEEWAVISLKPIPRMRDNVFRNASFSGQYTPQKECLIELKTSTSQEKIEVFALNAITMGRDKKRCTTKLALEPFLPAHIHHHNFQLSQRISGKHLSFMKKDNTVHVCDLGSKMGTMKNGEPCYRLSFYPIHTGDRISIAQVLELEAQVFFHHTHQESTPQALILKRTNNLPQKSHILLFDAVGIWPSHSSLVGPLRIGSTQAPLQIRRVDNTIHLCNVSSGTIRVQGLPLHNGESIPVCPNQRIITPNLNISISSI